MQWVSTKSPKKASHVFAKVIGACGRAVYDAMQFAEDGDKLKIDVVKKMFEEHCIPKQNKLIERDQFNARTQ